MAEAREPLPPPTALFYESADKAVEAELDVIDLNVGEGGAGSEKNSVRHVLYTKQRLWQRMGRELENVGWPPHKISAKIARTIQDKLARRTGMRTSVTTAHFYAVMREAGWVDRVRSAQTREGMGLPPAAVAPASAGTTTASDADSSRRQPAAPAGSEKPYIPPRLNRDLAGALRANAAVLNHAAKLLEDPEWPKAADLSVLDGYTEAVRDVRACTAVLEEESTRRRRIPKSAHHLFREICARTELSSWRVSVLFAERRLAAIRDNAQAISAAIAKQFRAGEGADPPPVLRPARRDTALVAGWSGEPCDRCSGWRVREQAAPLGSPDRICADCGAEFLSRTAGVCPACQALVYRREKGTLQCDECGEAYRVPAGVRAATPQEVIARAG